MRIISQRCPPLPFADGIYYDTMEIELDADGLDIYFTTDGTKPTVNSTKYEGPIRLTEGSNTIRAVAVSPKGVLSDEAIFSYEISYLEAEPTVVSPDSAIPGRGGDRRTGAGRLYRAVYAGRKPANPGFCRI